MKLGSMDFVAMFKCTAQRIGCQVAVHLASLLFTLRAAVIFWSFRLPTTVVDRTSFQFPFA